MEYLKVNLFLYLIKSLHIAVVVEHHLITDILINKLNIYIIGLL